jgi:hypothetical protein
MNVIVKKVTTSGVMMMIWEIDDMSVKIKDIKGALVEKKEECNVANRRSDPQFMRGIGFNACRDEQGEVSIGLNREKLAKIIESWESYKDGIKNIASEHYYTMNSLFLADAIIANEHEIIEVKP